MFKVNQETRLLEDTYLEKLKDLALPATQDRLMLIDKFGKMKAGPPFESIPPGQGGGGGNGGGGNPNPQSCSNTFEWEKISGTTNIYNCGFGNVGIGTTTPKTKVDIRGHLNIQNGNQAAVIYFPNSGGQFPNLYFRSDDDPSTYEIASERMIIKGDGNVGIGTITTNAPLQFANTVVNRKIVLYDGNNNDNQYYGFGINSGMLRYQTDDVAAAHVFYAATGATTSNELMRIKGNGYVGIGTSNPHCKLSIRGGANAMCIEHFGNNNPLEEQFSDIVFKEGADASYRNWILRAHTSFSSTPRAFEISSVNSGSELYIVGPDIKVGIGTKYLVYMLNVNGTIRAKKVRVDTGWGDYVFDEKHQRLTYEEKEKFYKKFNHLPNIPSAKEIEKDGLDIGDVMQGMVVNIEEDRLDITELYKRLLASEKRNEEQQKQLEEMQKEIEKLKEEK